MALGGKGAWAGWIAFASTIIIMTSLINIFQGTVALLDNERVVATEDAFVLVGMTWARVVAIIVIGLHAVSQVATLGAYPIYALLMIGLDTVVLFALTARWSDAATTCGRGKRCRAPAPILCRGGARTRRPGPTVRRSRSRRRPEPRRPHRPGGGRSGQRRTARHAAAPSS